MHRLRAAIAEQALFDALVLIDPIIRPHPRAGPLVGPATRAFTLGAVQRQTHWASRYVSLPRPLSSPLVPDCSRSMLACRDEARARFLSSPFFRAWHPAILDVYLECGLVDSGSSSGGVTLKTSNIQVRPSVHTIRVYSHAHAPPPGRRKR